MNELATCKTVVLIVEDEPLIRMDVADYVSDTGFATIEAGSGDEALAILSERKDIDVVFTDVNMPGKVAAWRYPVLSRNGGHESE